MKDLNDLSVHDLAADYKYRGYDRYRAWDHGRIRYMPPRKNVSLPVIRKTMKSTREKSRLNITKVMRLI